MKLIIELIEKYPTSFSAAAAISSAAFSMLVPRFRKWFVGLFQKAKIERVKREGFQKTVLEKLSYIESELSFNGGNSLRDMVWQLRNHQRSLLWRALRPSIEMGDSAKVEAVSESACHLFGVADPSFLLERNWLNCVAGGIDDFLNAFADCLRFGSSTMVFPMELKTYDGETLGKWEVRLNLITQKGAKNPKFSGYFKPIDELAKATAEKLA